MTWAVYNITTGDIYRIDNSEFPPEGETYVELAEEMLAWPDIPAGLTWRVVDGVPMYVDPRSTLQAQADKLIEITTVRDVHVFEPINVYGNVFAADAVSQQQVVASIQIAAAEPSTWTTEWPLNDNTSVTLTKSQLADLGRFIEARTTDLYAQAQVMIDANAVAATPEAVALILVQFYTDEVYYVAGVQTPRPDLDDTNDYTNLEGWVANGVDEVSYGPALPNPTTVRVECDQPNFDDPGVITITDGGFEFTTTLAGLYRFTITCFPYKTKTIVEIAT